MFPLFICLFLIFQGQGLVSAGSEGEVLEWTPDGRGYQMTFPSLKEAKLVKSEKWTAKSPSQSFVYNVECKVYENKNPIVNIYTSEGIIIDTLSLEDLGKDTCTDQNLEKYITPEEADEGVISMIYLLSAKNCVRRKYKIQTFNFMALVDREDLPAIDCPESILKFLQEISSRNQKLGGVVSLVFSGRAHLMDYINDFSIPGTPTPLSFTHKDSEGKEFKFICREDSTTKFSKILTGSIVYVDSYGEDIVLEKFKLKSSCTVENINVNRQYLDRSDRFKVVFKTAKGNCYEREYDAFKIDYFRDFVETTLVRKKANKVECPVRFTGDIGLDQYIPWWKFFTYPTAFSVDLRTKEEKEGPK